MSYSQTQSTLEPTEELSTRKRLRRLLLGGARDPQDRSVFHKISLTAFFAWIGLGSDGISSSCYGPEEAFLALGNHHFLAVFVALASALTILIISASYTQIIELFPSGGGGYVVASKLLSPTVGMVSGCALLIDYVLTISISISSGTDAFLSLMSQDWLQYKMHMAFGGLFVMIVLNARGVKESVTPLVPIFMVFVAAHATIILYALISHAPEMPHLAESTVSDAKSAISELGWWGMIFIMLKAFTMGAGTYTGIEAVSNGIPLLREPRPETAKKTMRYMAISLAAVATGLMLSYLLYEVEHQSGKTLNAVLVEKLVDPWNPFVGEAFKWVTLISEAAILVIAAQAGFLDGPRVLANMAIDRWFPTRFSTLSDRLVTQKGILLMGGAAAGTLIITDGSVKQLVVLYSINVFITFFLSQTGMVRHWLQTPRTEPRWLQKIGINGLSMIITGGILASVVIIKFNEGGWKTILITGCLVLTAIFIRRHYHHARDLLTRLDSLAISVEKSLTQKGGIVKKPAFDPKSKTAVVMVSGFNGLGLHTVLNIRRLFGDTFRNFVFVQVGVIDAGNFKGADEVARLQSHIQDELDRYERFINRENHFCATYAAIGTDAVEEISDLAPKIVERFPGAIFFGGQLVFAREDFFTRWLHNYTVFATQKRLYPRGIPMVILPIRMNT